MITRRLVPPASHAQPAYPTRPVTIVLPYPPGNAVDMLVRALTAGMAPVFGHPVVAWGEPIHGPGLSHAAQ